jgi:GDPmannose 4,6-dehydratase
MLQNKKADDFIICTGETHSLESFVKLAFGYFDLDYKKYLEINADFIRPNEILTSRGDASLAYEKLGWRAETKFEEVISKMIKYTLENTND